MVHYQLYLKSVLNWTNAIHHLINQSKYHQEQLKLLNQYLSILVQRLQESYHHHLSQQEEEETLKTQLSHLIHLLSNIRTWIHHQNRKPLLIQCVEMDKIHSKIQYWMKQVQTHSETLNISLDVYDPNQIQIAKENDDNAILDQIRLIFQQHQGSFEDISLELGITAQGIVDGFVYIQSCVQNHPTAMESIKSRVDEFMRFLQKKSGRQLDSPLPDWFSISKNEIEYIQDQPIGLGTFFGEVWKARFYGQEIAVERFLNPVYDQTVAELIQKELSLLHSLRHPNINEMIGGSIKTDRPFIVTRFYSNGNLHSFLQATANVISMKQRVKFIRDIASGMRYLHAKYVIHGDLHNENVLVDDGLNSILSGFGLTRVKEQVLPLSSFSSKKKRTYHVRWIAPERFELSGNPDPFKMDVFAFAMTAYHIVTGHMPFWEENNDDVVREYLKAGNRPTRPEGILDALWQVLDNCWNHQPQRRPNFDEISMTIQSIFEQMDGALLDPSVVQACKTNIDVDGMMDIETTASLIPFPNASPSLLVKAVRDRDIQLVSQLLQEGIQEQDVGQALLESAIVGDVNIAKRLIDHGAAVNDRDRNGETALTLAAFHQHVEVTQLLLENGADVNVQSSFADDTALIYAAYKGNLEISKLLIVHGANVNTQNAAGETALMHAARRGEVTLATLLIEHGADLALPNKDGKTALSVATIEQMISLLLDHGATVLVPRSRPDAPNQTINYLNGPANSNERLMKAIREGDFQTLFGLMEDGANLNGSDDFGTSPLMEAVSSGKVGMARLLVLHGAQANTEDMFGHTALTRAVGTGRVDLVRLVISHGANVNHQTEHDEYTALMLAVMQGHLDMVTLLIQSGARLNIRSKDGSTALMLAIREGLGDMANLLLDSGAE